MILSVLKPCRVIMSRSLIKVVTFIIELYRENPLSCLYHKPITLPINTIPRVQNVKKLNSMLVVADKINLLPYPKFVTGFSHDKTAKSEEYVDIPFEVENFAVPATNLTVAKLVKSTSFAKSQFGSKSRPHSIVIVVVFPRWFFRTSPTTKIGHCGKSDFHMKPYLRICLNSIG